MMPERIPVACELGRYTHPTAIGVVISVWSLPCQDDACGEVVWLLVREFSKSHA